MSIKCFSDGEKQQKQTPERIRELHRETQTISQATEGATVCIYDQIPKKRGKTKKVLLFHFKCFAFSLSSNAHLLLFSGNGISVQSFAIESEHPQGSSVKKGTTFSCLF